MKCAALGMGRVNLARNGATIKPPPAARVCTLLGRLIAPLSAELHRTALYRSLADGRVAKDDYAHLLQSLVTLHRSLEQATAATSHISAFDPKPFLREEALRRDLRLVHSHLPVRSNGPLDEFESRAQSWIRPPCEALIGAFYAVESERRHSLRLARPLAQALGLKIAPHNGLDYHLEGSERAARRFREFELWIDGRARATRRPADFAEGARRTMQTLIALHQGTDAPA
jgi:hypothetical protein